MTLSLVQGAFSHFGFAVNYLSLDRDARAAGLSVGWRHLPPQPSRWLRSRSSSGAPPPFAGVLLAPQYIGKFQVPTLRNVDKRPRANFVKASMHDSCLHGLEEVENFNKTRDKSRSACTVRQAKKSRTVGARHSPPRCVCCSGSDDLCSQRLDARTFVRTDPDCAALADPAPELCGGVTVHIGEIKLAAGIATLMVLLASCRGKGATRISSQRQQTRTTHTRTLDPDSKPHSVRGGGWPDPQHIAVRRSK